MQSRGFAFVSYYQKSDAESAMQALQGYGYDHLILKLEWAKPSLVSFFLGEGGAYVNAVGRRSSVIGRSVGRFFFCFTCIRARD